MPPPITLKDYETIYRVLHAVSSSVGNITGRSCLFYNVVGSFIISKLFKKKAYPVMGSAFLRVHDASNTVLSFSHLDDAGPTSSPDAFHCWIECNGYIIDFTAPEYSVALREAGLTHPVARKMFQKPLSSMAGSLDEVSQEGDFHLVPNPDLTNQLLQRFMERPAPGDLANICMAWLKKGTKKTPESFSMVNDLGEATKMHLSNVRLTSAW